MQVDTRELQNAKIANVCHKRKVNNKREHEHMNVVAVSLNPAEHYLHHSYPGITGN